MPLGRRSSIYLNVIYSYSIPLDLCVLGSCCEIVRYYMLDITALSELEAQAFRYTRINIC